MKHFQIILFHVMLCLICNLSCVLSISAEVVLDGTLGISKALQGPDYTVKSDYGKASGANLFHSFQSLTVESHESVTFTGPDYIKNIISRVTGGQSSWIDGVLRSNIPYANLYLLNPAGVIFGKNAALDVSGSFHVSTADYLRMGEQDRFYSTPFQGDVLSIASPTAFGFLQDAPAPITFEGGDVSQVSGLQVPDGETISVIGGDIDIQEGTFYVKESLDADGKPIQKIKNSGNLLAFSGRVNIASVASTGEVIPTEHDLDVSSVSKLGQITLSNRSYIDVSGERSGDVYIRAERFMAQNSNIYGETYGDIDGGRIDIRSTDVALSDGTQVIVNTYGYGKGSDLNIQAKEDVVISGDNGKETRSGIMIQSENGQTGNLTIQAKNIHLEDGGFIYANTYGMGDGGDITLDAEDNLNIVGLSSDLHSSEILVQTFGTMKNAGNAGNLTINAGKDITFNDGGWISSYTYGLGNGGQVNIKAGESITFLGEIDGYPSSIYAAAHETSNGGNGGDIDIVTKNLSLKDGAYLNASTFGPGYSGQIRINAEESVELSGASSKGWATGMYSDSTPKIDVAG
ncbi:MAG: filamentous hemagglutinin N-terminal domain-containing protein, partial [Desulfobacterales bacterium]|nr:filamentous hemagglutinin N-terminal domain-containing protein [Desulfobacterales bacterium]